ncbi:uncharacterized protein LOC115221259 [Octopus sinensis]|uniref:Uncharacterized protein LOC115221259 n=1 Tax=Octopus sinensis TaxID=2607531 RepID=A0A6P7T8K5_9MOLL|nr:uncharacterized protein LOC115221259 [Octopus sinensis]
MEAIERQAEKQIENKNYKEAIKKYDTLLTNPIIDPQYLFKRAKCSYHLNSFQNAQADVKEAIASGLTTTPVYILAGKIAAKQGKYEEALTYYKNVLKTEPGNPEVIADLKTIQKEILDAYEANSKDGEAEEENLSPTKFCTQDIYPGDDLLLKNEKEILEVNYKIVSEANEPDDDPRLSFLPAHMKNPAKLAIQGQTCQMRGQLEEAMQFFDMAILLDKTNHNFRLFKARLCFQMEKNLESLQQLWLIPKTLRNHEIWKLGGLILKDLDLPVLAEFWIRKATQFSNNADEECKIAFQQIRVKRLYSPLCLDYPVEVVFSRYGKAVVATRDIEANGVIFKDCPLVIGQTTDTHKTSPTCDNCGYSLMEPEHYFGDKLNTMKEELKELIESYWPKRFSVACEDCYRENYCSKACRTEAIEGYHRVLCPKNNPAANLLYDVRDGDGLAVNPETRMREEYWGGHFSPMIIPRMYASMISYAQKLMEEEGLTEPSLLHWSISKAPYRRFVAFGSSKAVQKNPLFYDLIKDVFRSYKIPYEITKADFDGRYNQSTCNLQAFGSYTTPYHKFLANLQEAEMDLTVVAMIKMLEKKPPHASLASLFPLHACTNHSCDNNADILDGEVLGRPGIWVMARRPISKGEEIHITYIDTAMQQKLRRAWLYRSFHFWCQCRRCEFEGTDSDVCTNCQKKAPEGKKFAVCSRCKKAWYCSTKCQKLSWKNGHKAICEKA